MESGTSPPATSNDPYGTMNDPNLPSGITRQRFPNLTAGTMDDDEATPHTDPCEVGPHRRHGPSTGAGISHHGKPMPTAHRLSPSPMLNLKEANVAQPEEKDVVSPSAVCLSFTAPTPTISISPCSRGAAEVGEDQEMGTVSLRSPEHVPSGNVLAPQVSMSTNSSDLLGEKLHALENASFTRRFPQIGTTYYVDEVRPATDEQPVFNIGALVLKTNDVVVFRWKGASHNVFETLSDLTTTVYGGRHSMSTLTKEKLIETGDYAVVRTNGDNWDMSFRVHFTHPGDYYFVCDRNPYGMRLHVQILGEKHRLGLKIFAVTAAAAIAVATIVGLIVGVSFALQDQDWFLSREAAATEGQYQGVKELQSLITLHLFPWIALGIIIVLSIIVILLVQLVRHCAFPPRKGAFCRGYRGWLPRAVTNVLLILAVINMILLIVLYAVQLHVSGGVATFSSLLTAALSDTLSDFLMASTQVNFLVANSTELLPSANIPVEDIEQTTNQLDMILNETKTWAKVVDDIAQGAMRVPSTLLFTVLQIGLFASCLAIGGSILRHHKVWSATSWIMVVSIAVYACGCGVAWMLAVVYERIYRSVYVFERADGSPALAEKWGFSNTSAVAMALTFCDHGADMVAPIITDIVVQATTFINASIDEATREEVGLVLDITPYLTTMTLDLLANNSAYMFSQLEILNIILTTYPDAVNDLFGVNDVVPLLEVALGLATTLYSLVNCVVFREVVGYALPVLQKDVAPSQTVLTALFISIFAYSFFLLGFCVADAIFMRHPRRHWYEPRTGRWFRFRFSYKIHRKLLLGGPRHTEKSSKAPGAVHKKGWTEMLRLRYTKLIVFASSILLFFDCIVLVIFDDFSRRYGRDGIIRALQYLGCIQLLLLLFATLMERKVRKLAFELAAAGLVVVVGSLALVRMTEAFVSVARCLNKTKSIGDMEGNPLNLTCPTVYVGLELEKGIYMSIIFLNCITLTTALIMASIYEQAPRKFNNHLPYNGILAPLQRWVPCLRRLFQARRTVKRAEVLLCITIVVVMIIVVATLDSFAFHLGSTSNRLWKGGAIVMVIDPTVGCNGDRGFCDMRVNELAWATTHNGHSSLDRDFVFPNQFYGIPDQLIAGIRGFMIDTYYDVARTGPDPTAEEIYLCHKICLGGRILLREALQQFLTFLTEYPEEVLMVSIEQYVNSTDIGRVFDEVGLTSLVWRVPRPWPNEDPDFVWPTLRELIDSNQRVLVFNSFPAAAEQSIGKPDWLYFAFDFTFENDFSTVSVDYFRCGIGRGWCTLNATDMDEVDVTNCSDEVVNVSLGSEHFNSETGRNPYRVRSKLSTLNHFITIGVGSPADSAEANQPAILQASIDNCSRWWSQTVNIVAIDFWATANPLETIHRYNLRLLEARQAHLFDSSAA